MADSFDLLVARLQKSLIGKNGLTAFPVCKVCGAEQVLGQADCEACESKTEVGRRGGVERHAGRVATPKQEPTAQDATG